MPTILLNLKTLEPVLATSFQGDPNSDVSYDYIPGSMIRGLLIGCYLRHHNQRELDLSTPDVQRLFFDAEQTRYLNANLVSQENHRTLPVPRSWFKPKTQKLEDSHPIDIVDLSVDKDSGNEIESPKLIADQFWTKEGVVRLYRPARRVNIHNQRDRRKGRSSKKEDDANSEGEIFRYDALDAGQNFQSAILCQENDLPLFKLLLGRSDLWIGGSRSAGYGHVNIKFETPDTWQEIQEPIDDREDWDHLTITLLSDMLLRDEYGQPMASPFLIQSAIEDVLGISLPTPKTNHIFSSSALIGGFNRKWGLPLPQVPALAAGTVVVFEDKKLTADQIQNLELHGLGDRRNEGFGRIAVNWHRKESFKGYKPESKKPIDPPQIGSDSIAVSIAETMAERLLRQRLDQYLKKVVNDNKLKRDEKTGSVPISNSQLSRLGLLARKGLEDNSLAPVTELLNRENLTSKALQQYQQAKMDNNDDPFYDRLKGWLENPIAWLNLPNRDLSITLSPTVNRRIEESHPDDPLVVEYTLRLIMAVAKQASKENQQTGEGSNRGSE